MINILDFRLNQDTQDRMASSILFKTVLASKETLTLADKVQIWVKIAPHCPENLRPRANFALRDAAMPDASIEAERVAILGLPSDQEAEAFQEAEYVREDLHRRNKSWYNHELTRILELVETTSESATKELHPSAHAFVQDAIRTFVRRERNRTAAAFIQTGAQVYRDRAVHLRELYNELTTA